MRLASKIDILAVEVLINVMAFLRPPDIISLRLVRGPMSCSKGNTNTSLKDMQVFPRYHYTPYSLGICGLPDDG